MNNFKKDITNVTSWKLRAREQSHLDAKFAIWNSWEYSTTKVGNFNSFDFLKSKFYETLKIIIKYVIFRKVQGFEQSYLEAR